MEIYFFIIDFYDVICLIYNLLPILLEIMFTSWCTYAVIIGFVLLFIIDAISNYFLIYKYENDKL